MLWCADFCPLKTPRHQICTRKYWQAITSCRNSSLKIVLISSPRYSTPIPRRDTASMKLEDIHGSNNRKIDDPRVFSQARSRCQWTTRCIRWCLMSSIMILTTQSNALRQIGTIKSRPPTISSLRRLADRTRTSMLKVTEAGQRTWSGAWIEAKSQRGSSSKS